MVPLPSFTSDKSSFGYSTVKTRWPNILKDCIRDVEDKSLVPEFEKILTKIQNDEKIVKFTDEEIQLNPDLKHYNEKFVDCHWHDGPWLYLECYLYQLINNVFLKAGKPDYDIFHKLKDSTLTSSEYGITELCKKLANFDFKLPESDKLIYFKEFIDISLWGNSTDLSLLAGNVTLEEIKSVQGAEIRKQNEKNILVNDTEVAFNHLSNLSPGPIDIVLDNSGFELFSDLVLLYFLLKTNMVTKVTLQCKKIPWFVSDTLIKDLEELLVGIAKYNNSEVDWFIKEIRDCVAEGKIEAVTNEFWTLSDPYWYLGQYPIYEQLKESKLVIFKGDLNYRKLTGDLQWPKTTPFTEAIRDLSKTELPILSLRTCKADVVVGLPEGVEETLKDKSGEFWAASGKYAVINFYKS